MKPTREKSVTDYKLRIQSALLLLGSVAMFIYTSKKPKSPLDDTSLFENFVLVPSCILQLVLCIWIQIWDYNGRLSFWVQFFVFMMTICFFLADVVLGIGF